MPSLFKPLRIGISMAEVTVIRADTQAAHPLATATPAAVAEALGLALDEAGVGRGAATIVLADEWTRLFMVTPPRNVERMRDCEAAVALRFQSLYGEPCNEWSVQADHDAAHAFLACAMPRALRDALLAACSARRLAVIGMAPQFVGSWNRWRRRLGDGAWLGVVHAGSLTLAATSGGRLAEVRRALIPPGALRQRAWLNDQLGREALRLGLPMPRGLWVCGDAPEAWLCEGDGAWIDCRRLDADTASGHGAGFQLACGGA